LQVLDGRPVAAGERAGAQARFAGRLQADAAAERLGHRDFGAAAALALGGMGLRALGGVFAGGAWRALRRLDLDDNLLVEVPLLRSPGNAGSGGNGGNPPGLSAAGAHLLCRPMRPKASPCHSCATSNACGLRCSWQRLAPLCCNVHA